MDNKNTKSTGGKRAALITLCVVLGIVLALLLTGTIFVTQKLGKINRPGNNDPLTPDQLASIEGVDYICGNAQKLSVVDAADELFQKGGKNTAPQSGIDLICHMLIPPFLVNCDTSLAYPIKYTT